MATEEINFARPLGDARAAALVRRFAHDIRNHLNGFEMDVFLLEDIIAGSKDEGAIGRLRRQAAEIEVLLGALVGRFVAPERQKVSAVDVFHRWQSRAKNLVPDSALEWHCEVRSEVIEIDMKMIADFMTELAMPDNRARLRASASPHHGGVSFTVSWPGALDAEQAFRLPECELVIARNGGRFEHGLEQASGRYAVGCWFPLCEE